jgi:hypothetical protein
MKLFSAAVGIAALCAATAGAQTMQTTEKSKIEVKGGKEVTVAGCLERGPAGGYLLTSTRTGDMKYMLVTNDDLSKHLGHRVEVKGRATDKGDAKVKIQDKVKTDGTHADDKDRTTTSEAKGDMPDMHYLGVKSLKMIADSCM